MFIIGMDLDSRVFFGSLTLLIVFPTCIKLFNLLIAYTKDSTLNGIYLERLWKLYIHFEDLIRKETLQNNKQNHLGKRIKKFPKKIWNSLKSKYKGRINEK